jgi:hypothetical protein
MKWITLVISEISVVVWTTHRRICGLLTVNATKRKHKKRLKRLDQGVRRGRVNLYRAYAGHQTPSVILYRAYF